MKLIIVFNLISFLVGFVIGMLATLDTKKVSEFNQEDD